jgi:hypothetical protein
MSTRRERAKAHSAQQSKQMAVAIAKPVNEHPVAKKMGEFFIDVAKLVIGVVFLLVAFGMYLINYANKK